MKKYLVSFIFAVIFVGYATYQSIGTSTPTVASTETPSSTQTPATSAAAGSAPPPENTVQTRTVATAQTSSTQTSPQQTQTQPVQQPAPAQPKGQYADGTYTGPAVNAFYGFIQVQATVSGGALTDVQFLRYPNDRGTSVYINQQAMPLLRQEAIAAQSAQVNGVSGASDTSAAFVQSLAAALSQAKS